MSSGYCNDLGCLYRSIYASFYSGILIDIGTLLYIYGNLVSELYDMKCMFKCTYILGPLSDENSQWKISTCGFSDVTGFCNKE